MATTPPVTVWRNQDGLGEYSNGSANNIADKDGNLLVDKNGNNVVDTGVVFTNIPATTWETDDSQ